MIAAYILMLVFAAASKSFPLTFGGFTNLTIIQGMLATPLQHKLLIAFKSTDSVFIDNSAIVLKDFYTLFDYQNTKEYLWSK